MNEKQYSLSEAAKILGVSTKTLRNWDNEGKIDANRTAGGHRRISESEILKFQRMQNGEPVKTETKETDKTEQQRPDFGLHRKSSSSDRRPNDAVGLFKPTVARLADSKNQDEVIDFTRKLTHQIEDVLNARITDEEYLEIEKIIFSVHARGLPKPDTTEVLRPGYLSNI